MPHYAGDRIFLILPDDPVSRQATMDLMKRPLWNRLPAVKQGRCYMVEESIWNIADACSSERLLDMLPKLLQDPTSCGLSS